MSAAVDTLKIQALKERLGDLQTNRRELVERICATPVHTNVIALRAPTQRNGGAQRAVLVVEDDADQRTLAVQALAETLHVPVYGAATLAEARDLVERILPAVVVLDWYMDGATAQAFLETLRYGMRVVVRSGAADAVLQRIARRYRIEVVRKGSDDDARLAETVRAELDAATG